LGMPCPGQCLNLGIDGTTHATKIPVSTKNAVIPVWPNECSLQKVHARAQRIYMNSAVAPSLSPVGQDLDQLCVNAIRTLSIDAVQAANSGHPGTPMAMAPVAYWT
jgi:transketolase-like protein